MRQSELIERIVIDIRIAVSLSTILPTAPEKPVDDGRIAAASWALPVAGLVVSLIAAIVYELARRTGIPASPAALLALAATIIVTGAIHEDGLADTADGLGGGKGREQKLEIMRDSRIGTYGVLGLGVMASLRVACLMALPGWAVPLALIAGHAASRTAMLWVMASSDYVRAQGAGSAVAGGIDREAVQVAAATTGIALLPMLVALPFTTVMAGLAGLLLGYITMRRWYEPRLGGYTGDCLGAVQQMAEAGFYLGLLALTAQVS